MTQKTFTTRNKCFSRICATFTFWGVTALLTQPGQPGSLMQVGEGQITHKCHENPKARVQHSGPCCKETLKCHVCMENRAPWSLSHNRISCCRGGCEGNKSMVCLQISWRFQWNTIHSSPVRHLMFTHWGFQVMPFATDTHRAGLTACVVTLCWPHFDCPVISGLSQCLSSPNLSPTQAGSPMGPATGSSAATRVTVLPLLRQYPSDTKWVQQLHNCCF